MDSQGMMRSHRVTCILPLASALPGNTMCRQDNLNQHLIVMGTARPNRQNNSTQGHDKLPRLPNVVLFRNKLYPSVSHLLCSNKFWRSLKSQSRDFVKNTTSKGLWTLTVDRRLHRMGGNLQWHKQPQDGFYFCSKQRSLKSDLVTTWNLGSFYCVWRRECGPWKHNLSSYSTLQDQLSHYFTSPPPLKLWL